MIRPSTRLAPAMLLGLAASAAAQRQFEELPRATLALPQSTSRPTDRKSLGDLDGDGDLDVVAMQGWYRNLGGASYGYAGPLASGSSHNGSNYMAVANAIGDLDGDGDLDVVFGWTGLNGAWITWARNDGTGQFTQQGSFFGSYRVWDLALGDVDGDGDLDVLTAEAGVYSGSSHLLLNDGSGGFTDASANNLPATSQQATALELGDIDGDGDVDAVLVGSLHGWLPQHRVLVNDGGGRFTDQTANRMPQTTNAASDIALGDLDGDGDLDIAVANGDFTGGGQNGIYLNDGSGTFVDATGALLPLVLDVTRAVAIGDVDGDGAMDLVFGNDGQDRLLIQGGNGTFVDTTTTRLPPESASSSDVVLGDMDGDGDLDIVGSRQWLNLRHQIHAPAALQVGHNYTVTAHRRHGPPATVDFAAPYAAFAAANVPLANLGTLGLDPATMIPLPLIWIQPPSNSGSLSLVVPNQTGLVGLPVFVQALFAPYPGNARLSHVLAEVIQ